MLERLRSLQGIHAGAAQARGDLEDLERVATEMGEEIGEWRKAVERCEEKLRLGEEVVRRNGEVVGGLVRGVEGRLRVLEGSMKGP